MRIRLFTVLLAILTLALGGCATGFRLGGERFGAGVGGYVGAPPSGHTTYSPPPSP